MKHKLLILISLLLPVIASAQVATVTADPGVPVTTVRRSSDTNQAITVEVPKSATVNITRAYTWVKVANEGSLFKLDVFPQVVRFGAAGTYVEKTVNINNGNCSNSYFGSDPAMGVVKTCEVRSGPAVRPVP